MAAWLPVAKAFFRMTSWVCVKENGVGPFRLLFKPAPNVAKGNQKKTNL